MRRRFSHLVLLFCLAALIGSASPAMAETRLLGSAGVDITAYGFSGSLLDTTLEYSSHRSLSDHYVDMSLTGTVVNENFATFGLRAKVLGSFSQSSTETTSNNFYMSPALNSYYASVVLLPDKRYPLRMFVGRQLDFALEYESQNRSNASSVQPSLSVVRRYRREADQYGAVLNISLAENTSFLAQTRTSQTKALREYDFGEDNDIWVDLLAFVEDETVDAHRVEVVNQLEDATVRVIILNGDTATLAPAEVVQLVVDSGLQTVTILPLSIYNQFEFTVRVAGEQSWKILYVEPPSPRDQQSEETGSRVQFMTGETGKKTLVAYYDHTDRFDPSTGQTSLRVLANNSMEYVLSGVDKIKMETGYSVSESIRGGIVNQANTNISHETSFSHAPRRGFTGSLIHEFTTAKTEAGDAAVTTNINQIKARAGRPFRKYKYRIDMETDVSLRSDDAGTGTNQYQIKVQNRMEKPWLGMMWQPMNSTEYTIRDQSISDGSTGRVKTKETLFNLDGTSLASTALGDVSLKMAYGWRRQADRVGAEIKQLYGFDLLLSKQIRSGLQVGMLVIQKWESYGGGPWNVPANAEEALETRPTDHKTTYRGDLKADPWESLSFGLSYSIVTEEFSEIAQSGLSLVAILPWLHLPITAGMGHSVRDIGDLPTQTDFNMNMETKYAFRQIEIDLTYKYAHEKLVTQSFDFFEIIATITRSFGR